MLPKRTPRYRNPCTMHQSGLWPEFVRNVTGWGLAALPGPVSRG